MKTKVLSANLWMLFLLFMASALTAQVEDVDCSRIDARARRSPKPLYNDLPGLTAYLTDAAPSELEKVRAIYFWVATHINYDREAAGQDKRINHSIKDILDRKLALCFGYAQLLQEMCDLAGMNCPIINGYGKDPNTTQSSLEEPNHSWNAVKIDGNWFLLDATWGSSTKSYDDHFLVSPEKFVLTHLPGNPMWQLLPNPVPAEIFIKSDTAVLRQLSIRDTPFAFLDSLDYFYGLSPAQQRLHEYERTFQAYPSQGNGRQLGHALIDYAGILADSLDQLSPEIELQRSFRINTEVIKYCRRAGMLTSLYSWQEELFINALINQAVLLYNWQDDLKQETDQANQDILSFLEEARQLLNTSEDSYFTRIARQQCERYLDIVRSR